IVCEKLLKHLDGMQPARSFSPDGEKENLIIGEMQLLTSKPTFYVANVDEESLGHVQENAHYRALSELAVRERALVVPICAQLEAQIAELDPADRPEFLASAGLKE